MFSKLFVLLALVALAATGALEWFKAVTKNAKLPGWIVPVLSGVFCLIVGVASVFGGFFADYFVPASALLKLAAGIVIGLVVLAVVELAYQLLVQLVMAFVKFVIGLLSAKAGVGGGEASDGIAEAAATAISGDLAKEPESQGETAVPPPAGNGA
jgi:hypothetical protein